MRLPSKSKLLEVIAIQAEIARMGLDLGGVMNLVVERTLHLINVEGAAIELAEGDEMVYRAAAGLAKPQLGLRLRRESSLSGLCVQSGTPLRSDDVTRDPRVDREACRSMGLGSMVVVPLQHGNLVVGVLKAMSPRFEAIDDLDIELLRLLCQVVASAMYFAVRYDADGLLHRATHDALTGLANRALFMERLRSSVAQARYDHAMGAVLILDMDGLKPINDTHGHRAGDAALVELGRRLKAQARATDTVARLGGDEFGVLLRHVEGDQTVQAIEERVQHSLTPPLCLERCEVQLSASVGHAIFPKEGSTPDELLELADQRMYAAKSWTKAQTTLSGVADLR